MAIIRRKHTFRYNEDNEIIGVKFLLLFKNEKDSSGCFKYHLYYLEPHRSEEKKFHFLPLIQLFYSNYEPKCLYVLFASYLINQKVIYKGSYKMTAFSMLN